MSLADQLKSVKVRSTVGPKEKSNEQLLCPDSETYRKLMNETQFECYFDKIEKWTFPSVIIPMNHDDIDALRQGYIYFKSLSSTDDDDKRTEECFEKYPRLKILAQTIDSCNTIPRPIFVRLSTRSAKDAILFLSKNKFQQTYQTIYDRLQTNHEYNRRLLALDETTIRLLAVNDGFHAIQLLLASERIQDDLCSSTSINLIVRQFLIDRTNLKSEFRAFIYKRQFTALTQYNEYIVDEYLIANKDKILKTIQQFFSRENLLEQIPYENCVLDLILIENDDDQYFQVCICEINPLAEFAGTGLFSWLDDRKILLGIEPFQFRIRENYPNESVFNTNEQWQSLINNL